MEPLKVGEGTLELLAFVFANNVLPCLSVICGLGELFTFKRIPKIIKTEDYLGPFLCICLSKDGPVTYNT